LLALADQVSAAVDKAGSRASSPAIAEGRVRVAVKRILSTEAERRAEEAWRERARRRRVEVVWDRPGDPSSLRAVVHEEPAP
jgi:hypothetical protein